MTAFTESSAHSLKHKLMIHKLRLPGYKNDTTQVEFQAYEIVFNTHKIVFHTYEIFSQTYEIVFQTSEYVFKTHNM